MQGSKDIYDHIDAYLTKDLSHDELFDWLLESADLYCEAISSESEVNVWARTLNMLCLLHDRSIGESVVRQELQALAANRPASIYRIEISRSIVEQGRNVVVWDVPSVRPGSSDSTDTPVHTEEWVIVH